MMKINDVKIAIIEVNGERRSRITRMAHGIGVHVEPFESIEDYRAYPINASIILVCDQDGAVSSVISTLMELEFFPQLIAYKGNPSIADVVNAVKIGAWDYLGWPFTHEELAKLIDRVPDTNARCSGTMRALKAKQRLKNLSSREAEVLGLVSKGYSTKEIAKHLEISPRTVEIHRANIITKTDVRNSQELVKISVESNFLDFEEVPTRISA